MSNSQIIGGFQPVSDPHLDHLFDGEPILNVYNSEITNLSAGTPGPDLLKKCIQMFKNATDDRMVSTFHENSLQVIN